MRTTFNQRFTLFAVLWALGHLLHTWHQGGVGTEGAIADPWLLLPLLAALIVLASPSDPRRLALLAVAQIVAFAAQYPFVANHWTLAAFVNAGLVFSLRRAQANDDDDIEASHAHQQFEAYARTVFLLAYAAAAIAKANTGFMDRERSCALDLLMHAGFGADLPPWAASMVIGVSLFTELLIPLLLLLPRTRLFGIAVAGVFHLLLAAPPALTVMDYSMLLFALLSLFAPADAAARLRASFQDSEAVQRWSQVWHLRVVRWGTALGVLLAAAGRSAVLGPELWAVVSWSVFLLSGTFVVACGIAVLSTYRATPSRPPTGRSLLLHGWLRPGWATALTVLLVLNIASPYLGGKTTSSFTMFSNLRTEGGTSNHLVLPRLGWDSPQDDLVLIARSSNDALANAAEEGLLLTYHELRRILTADPTAQVTFTRFGEVHDMPEAQQNPELVSLSPASRKLMHFRPVNQEGLPICQA